jgi:bacterioferritin-associated ferredoxin
LTQAVAAPKPIEIDGCCGECVSPARTVISAAKSVVGAN